MVEVSGVGRKGLILAVRAQKRTIHGSGQELPFQDRQVGRLALGEAPSGDGQNHEHDQTGCQAPQ